MPLSHSEFASPLAAIDFGYVSQGGDEAQMTSGRLQRPQKFGQGVLTPTSLPRGQAGSSSTSQVVSSLCKENEKENTPVDTQPMAKHPEKPFAIPQLSLLKPSTLAIPIPGKGLSRATVVVPLPNGGEHTRRPLLADGVLVAVPQVSTYGRKAK